MRATLCKVVRMKKLEVHLNACYLTLSARTDRATHRQTASQLFAVAARWPAYDLQSAALL